VFHAVGLYWASLSDGHEVFLPADPEMCKPRDAVCAEVMLTVVNIRRNLLVPDGTTGNVNRLLAGLRQGQDISPSPQCPDWLWDPPSLLSSGASFFGGKAAGA
jgi:hypothetical protein